MLTLEARNLGIKKDGAARYHVVVRVNLRKIWHGIVDHHRERGFARLLRDIATKAEGRD